MNIIEPLGQTKRVWLLTLCCFTAALIVAFVMEQPSLFDPYVIHNDTRQHIYWMAHFQDPELFRDDPLTDFTSRPRAAPYGFVALYYLMSFFVEPLLFSKLLPLLLIPLCAVVLFRLGLWLKDALSGFILVAFFLTVIWDAGLFSGGLAHSFSYPILILFLYSLVRTRYLIASALLVAGALFYPPTVLVCAGAWAISFLDVRRLTLGLRKKGLVHFLAGTVVALTVLMFVYIVQKDDAAGRLVTYAEAVTMPEFQEGGRVSYFFGTWTFHFLKARRSGLGFQGQLKILFITAVLIGLLLRARAFTTLKEVWYLVMASLCCFVLAHLFLFRLFLPSRYAMVAIPLSIMVFVSIHLRPTLEQVAELIPILWLRSRRVAAADVGAVALVACFFVLGMGVSSAKVMRRFTYDRLTSFIATLPKDAMIAGHPIDMDWIPIFSRRKVLVNRELSLPYHVNYYRMIRERTNDLLDAYYSDSEAQIARFCGKHSVDYLVVNRVRFSPGYLASRPIYDEPYNTYIKVKIAGRQRFAALELPPEMIVWQDDQVLVADCRRMADAVR